MPYSVALSHVSGAAVTIFPWKDEGSGDDGGPEPAESRSSKTRQGAMKASRPRGSGKSRAARC